MTSIEPLHSLGLPWLPPAPYRTWMSKIDPAHVEKLRQAIDVLVRVFKIAEGHAGDEAAPKLNPSDVQSILFLADHPGSIAADLGQFLGVVPTTTSAIVDRLVRRDLVVRNRTESNRRVVQLALSDEGRRVAAALLAQQDQHCKVMLATLDKADRKAFVRAMEKIAKSIG